MLFDLLDLLFTGEDAYTKARRDGRRPPGRSVWVDIHGNTHNIHSRDNTTPCGAETGCHCKRKARDG